jgi:undecaprenyl-diphosphatase
VKKIIRVLHIGFLAMFLLSICSFAIEIDKYYTSRSDDGIYKLASPLPYLMLAGVATKAVVDGNNTKAGVVAWKAADAAITGAIAEKILAYSIGRKRPNQTESSSEWFSFDGSDSFPSGHVTVVTAIVTPYILNYKDEYPAIWALSALPIFEAIGRVKAKKHWTTDTLAGIALGVASGYLANNRNTPLILEIIPLEQSRGIYMGIRCKF